MISHGRSVIFGLWLLLIPLPLFEPIFRLEYPTYYDQFSSFSLYPHFILAPFILFFGWQATKRPTIFQPWALTIPLVGLTLITAVSVFYATIDGRLAAIVLARLLISLLLYFALKAGWLTQKGVYAAFLLFLFVQGTAAIAQFWLQDDLGLQWLGELDVAPEPGRGSIIFGQSEYWLRSYGLAPHPNILGGFVGSALLIVIFGRGAAHGRWLGLLSSLAIFLGTLGLCVTFSRSAWLGTAAGLLFCLCLKLLVQLTHPSNFKAAILQFGKVTGQTLIPIVLAIILFVTAARDPLQARSQPQENETVTQSVGERQLLIAVAFNFIEESFPWGIGAGNFGPAMLFHPDRETFPNIHPVHNLPLLLTAELGLFGGAAWLWLMFFPAGFCLLAWRQGSLSLSLIGISGALFALAAVDLLDYYSWGWSHGLTWRWMLFALFANAYLDQAQIQAD